MSNVFFTTLVSFLLFAQAKIWRRITCTMFLIMYSTITFLEMRVEAYETYSFQAQEFYHMRSFATVVDLLYFYWVSLCFVLP